MPPAPLDASIVAMDVVNGLINKEGVVSNRSETFKWLFRFITGHDFEPILERCFRALIGDWQSVGLVAGLYQVYADYYGLAGTSERDAAAMTFLFWEGASADLAAEQCSELGYRIFLNQSDLSTASHRFTAAAMGIYGLLSDAKALIDQVVAMSAQVDDYVKLKADLPVPVLVAQVGGIVVAILEKLFKTAEAVMLIVRIVKAIIEVLMVLQASLVEFTDRLPSRA